MHIVFSTFGSLGDVYPFLAVGRELQNYGHRVTLATSSYHRATIEGAGFGFRAVRPDIADFGGPAGLFKAFSAGPDGPLRVLRRQILPHLRETYEDLQAAASDADFLGAHPLYYPAPLVAEKLKLPWAATLLQPMTVQSSIDPSMFPWLPPMVQRMVFRLGGFATRPLVRPVRQLRRELGLPPPLLHPMFGGQFSPGLNLALFSPLFASPQADWPGNTLATGFPFFEEAGNERNPSVAMLIKFLEDGPAPLVFSLGSTAVELSTEFYLESHAAVLALGRRAVLLAGSSVARSLPASTAQILSLDYAPHGMIFPRAEAIIHSGGIGTTAQALRSGRPQLIVPFGFDQPDNARRAARLGAARILPVRGYNSRRAAACIQELLANDSVRKTATTLGARIRQETGAANAAIAILKLLGS